MTISEYLKTREISPSALASLMGVPASTITRVVQGKRTVGPKLAMAIERATGGAISKSDLRPDIWPVDGEAA